MKFDKPMVKSTAIRHTMNFIEARFGKEGLQKVIESLHPEEQKILSEAILPTDWSPLDLFIHLRENAIKLLNNGDESLAVDMGRFNAEKALTGIYRVFFKAGLPEYMIRLGVPIYRTFYSHGRIEVASKEKNKVILRIKDQPGPYRVIELGNKGFVEKALEMTKSGKWTHVEITRSVASGGDVTEIVCKWD